MKAPLIPFEGDRRWDLVTRILGLVETRAAKKIIAREGVKPVDVAVRMLKVALLAMCFSTEISHLKRELSEKETLRSFVGLQAVSKRSVIEDVFKAER
jgi:hypothetical protein